MARINAAGQRELWIPQSILDTDNLLRTINRGYLLPQNEVENQLDLQYLRGTYHMIYGEEGDELFQQNRISALGTVGGTNAFALAMDILRLGYGDGNIPPVYMGIPAYGNHRPIIEFRSIQPIPYPHVNAEGKFDLALHLAEIKKSQPKSIHIFQGLHNPTGENAYAKQEWDAIAEEMAAGERIAIFDLAYLGLKDGMYEDATCLHSFRDKEIPFILITSNSKNTGEYGGRAGIISMITAGKDETLAINRMLNTAMRLVNSSPPWQAEAVIGTVFTDTDLRQQFIGELAEMASALTTRRQTLTARITDNKTREALAHSEGMFCMLPDNFTEQALIYLEDTHNVYTTGRRFNFGGLVRPSDIDIVATAINDINSRFPRLG